MDIFNKNSFLCIVLFYSTHAMGAGIQLTKEHTRSPLTPVSDSTLNARQTGITFYCKNEITKTDIFTLPQYLTMHYLSKFTSLDDKIITLRVLQMYKGHKITKPETQAILNATALKAQQFGDDQIMEAAIGAGALVEVVPVFAPLHLTGPSFNTHTIRSVSTATPVAGQNPAYTLKPRVGEPTERIVGNDLKESLKHTYLPLKKTVTHEERLFVIKMLTLHRGMIRDASVKDVLRQAVEKAFFANDPTIMALASGAIATT